MRKTVTCRCSKDIVKEGNKGECGRQLGVVKML